METINQMYAFIVEDTCAENNSVSEGVLAVELNSQWLPLVGADMARVKALYPVAVRMSARLNKDFKIVKFSTRTDITAEVAAEIQSISK